MWEAPGGASGVSLPAPRDIRSRFFPHHARDVARLNHGSFGACPAPVLEEQERQRALCLQQPDLFFRKLLKPRLDLARVAVAAQVGCRDPEQLVLIDNVTTGAAMVAQLVAEEFRAGKWERGDAVLLSSHTYAAVRKCLQHLIVPAGGELRTVALPFPFPDPDAIVNCFRRAAEQVRGEGQRVALVMLDHVSSMPALVLPVADVISAVREAGVGWVMVDGAHALGSIPELDLDSLGADFYTSNIHKWAFAPHAVALFHCAHPCLLLPPSPGASFPGGGSAQQMRRGDPRHEGEQEVGGKGLSPGLRLHYPVISHGYDAGLVSECDWVGTRDYSAALAVPAALDWARGLTPGGLTTLAQHNHRRLMALAEMLAQAWGTFLAVPPDMCASMAMLALPQSISLTSEDSALALQERLREEYSVEAPVLFWPRELWGAAESAGLGSTSNVGACGAASLCHAGVSGYVRVSCQLYNTDQDFFALRDAVLKCSLPAQGPP